MTIMITSTTPATILLTCFKCFGSTYFPLFYELNMPYFGADNINFTSPEAKPFIAASNCACYISCDVLPKFSTVQILLIIGLAGSAIAIGLATTRLPGKPTAIKWERDYNSAIQRAQAEKKLIVADMFTDWCVLCKKMDAETYADPQ